MHRRATLGPHFILGQARPTGACRSTQTLGCRKCRARRREFRFGCLFNRSGNSQRFSGALAALRAHGWMVQVSSTLALHAAVLRRAVRVTRLPPEAATILRVRSNPWLPSKESVGGRAGHATGLRNGLGECSGLKYRLLVLEQGVQMHFRSSARSSVRADPTYSGSARARPWFTERRQGLQPNPSFERTCTGVPRLALISFWARRVPPAPAAQLKR